MPYLQRLFTTVPRDFVWRQVHSASCDDDGRTALDFGSFMKRTGIKIREIVKIPAPPPVEEEEFGSDALVVDEDPTLERDGDVP